MQKKLDNFKHEFDEILSNTRLTIEHKNMLLATLMTKMEHEFKIPPLNNEQFNAENERIITLYREISHARKF